MYNYSRLECHTYGLYIYVSLPIMNNVTKHTRVRKIDGVDEARRQIFCPTCSAPTVVYHFSWSAIECPHCHNDINKTEWELCD